jgi:hypothetical protein
LFNVGNIFIFMILCDFCLFPIIYVWKFESHVQLANRCAPWKVANGSENLVLQALQFQCLPRTPKEGAFVLVCTAAYTVSGLYGKCWLLVRIRGNLS